MILFQIAGGAEPLQQLNSAGGIVMKKSPNPQNKGRAVQITALLLAVLMIASAILAAVSSVI